MVCVNRGFLMRGIRILAFAIVFGSSFWFSQLSSSWPLRGLRAAWSLRGRAMAT